MTAISTFGSHVSRALDFYNKDSIYFCIGRTTQWPDEQSPPELLPSVTDVTEIIGFKKVEVKQLVIPDANGTIVYHNSKWSSVIPSNALSAGAKWVYVKTVIQYSDLPVGYYRQVGLYSNLIPATGVPAGQFSLLPDQVSERGILELADNRIAAYHAADGKDTLSVIIQF
jgi:hypothetical protein